MHRFFVSPELLQETNIDVPLPKELAHQVRDVIRLDIGEQLLLLDSSGDEILATVAKTNKTTVEVHLLERRPGKSEPAIRIILCQGLLKSTRFEWILEKGTELGVSVVSPIIFRRSMAGLQATGSSKFQRWQRIIQEAAEQCGRSRLPKLLPIRSLMDTLKDITPGTLAIMPWEEEHTHTLQHALQSFTHSHGNVGATLAVAHLPQATLDSPDNVGATHEVARLVQPRTIVLFIGPEGGLMAEEVALAQRHDVQVVTLGERILRAETAAIVTVANVMYELER